MKDLLCVQALAVCALQRLGSVWVVAVSSC